LRAPFRPSPRPAGAVAGKPGGQFANVAATRSDDFLARFQAVLHRQHRDRDLGLGIGPVETGPMKRTAR
jgi:hypothetical protein